MICQQVTLSGDAEWPKVADAVIEADFRHFFGNQAILPLALRILLILDSQVFSG